MQHFNRYALNFFIIFFYRTKYNINVMTANFRTAECWNKMITITYYYMSENNR